MAATILQSTRKRRDRGGITPDINVTPLVDVVLVLLIIFMVIAPEMEHGERVELPAITTPDPKSKSKLDPITVTIAASGSLFLEKEPITDLAALADRVKALHAQDPDRRVLLKGDAGLPYARFREALASFQKNGVPGVSLSVGQKGKGRNDDAEGSAPPVED